MICSIVVLYENEEKELEHINDYSEMVDKIFVIDNSKRTNKKKIEKILYENDCIEKLEFFHFPENIGLCCALNFGMEKAHEYGCEWALIMDADSSFLNNIVKIYLGFLNQSIYADIAVLAPVHIFDRGKNKTYEGFKQCKWAMTSGCFYNISIFIQLGGFKEELYVDGLDIDYGYRANKNGYKIIQVGNAKLNHHPGTTHVLKIGSRELVKYGYATPYRYYMQARALIWVIFKYRQLSDVLRYFYKWFKVLFLFDSKKEYIKQLLEGTKEGIKLWKNEKK